MRVYVGACVSVSVLVCAAHSAAFRLNFKYINTVEKGAKLNWPTTISTVIAQRKYNKNREKKLQAILLLVELSSIGERYLNCVCCAYCSFSSATTVFRVLASFLLQLCLARSKLRARVETSTCYIFFISFGFRILKKKKSVHHTHMYDVLCFLLYSCVRESVRFFFLRILAAEALLRTATSVSASERASNQKVSTDSSNNNTAQH